jgi:signal transduction histidine kinase
MPMREAGLGRGFEAVVAVVTAGLGAATPDDGIQRMVAEICDRLPWDRVVLALQVDGELEVTAECGASRARGRRLPADRGVVGRVVASGEPHLAADHASGAGLVPGHALARSEMAAPLLVEGELLGVLAVASGGRHLDEDDLAVLVGLAEPLALVVQHLRRLSDEQATVARLHEVDALKSRLLTIASHELRTPLTVVLGFAEVLAEHVARMPADQATGYADAIARQASALSRTVEQMLLAAQLDQGELRVQVTSCDLLAVVARALHGERGRIVEVLPGTDLRVRADPFRLQQVLESILDNAVKYAGEAGRVQLDARAVGSEVVILIRDEGPGIPATEREAVFEAFHQVGEHGVAGRRGLGLGLAVARNLLRLMDGDLALATAEGYGATFTLRLPRGDAAPVGR